MSLSARSTQVVERGPQTVWKRGLDRELSTSWEGSAGTFGAIRWPEQMMLTLLLLPAVPPAQRSGHRCSGRSGERAEPEWPGKGLWRTTLKFDLEGSGGLRVGGTAGGAVCRSKLRNERGGCREEEAWDEGLTAGKKELAHLDLQ